MGMSFTDCMKKRCCCYIQNPRWAISMSWIVSLVFVGVSFLIACIAAAKMAKAGSAGKAAGFCAVWTALLLIVVSILGSVVMKRTKSPLSVGAFLGVIFIMINQMLILFGIFVERSQTPGQALSITQSQQAMAVFAFFLFIVYSAFGLKLYIFRNDIMEDGQASQQEQQVQN